MRGLGLISLVLGLWLLLLARDHLVEAHRASGLYVDNGHDQTVIQRSVSESEKREVEHEILSLLGLPERPPRRLHNTPNGGNHRPQVRRSAPRFLLDVYRDSLARGSSRLTTSEFDLSGQELRAIDQSDAIATFAARTHHVPGLRHERDKRLWFDVSELPTEGERLLGAELRIYRRSGLARNKHHHHHHQHSSGDGSFSLSLYQVLGSSGQGANADKELRYLDSVNASAGHDGWIALNCSAALASWVREPESNRGVYLSVLSSSGSDNSSSGHREMRPDEIGLVGVKGTDDRQPFLVAFLKSSPHSKSKQHNKKPLLEGSSKTRSKRETRRGRRKLGGGHDVSEYRSVNPYLDPLLQQQQQQQQQQQHNSRTCKIQTLYVSFRDLQWQDWIIAPDGYDAYYCSGECNFPLNAHMNATNHAIVQTLVHLVNPGKVPKPCCAPTKLSPISVLYFLDESNVILKKYKNMVVKSCGCH
ncbi:protein 60A [Trichogramma pretiosum]|nr:protein 60A [Trichogramma pretiosum]